MPRGGKRDGAGRKPGRQWRSPKPPSIRSAARAKVREVIAGSADPLSVLVEMANDRELDAALRVQAATAACPFLFPRLSAAVVATAPPASADQGRVVIERVMSRIAAIAATLPTIEGASVPVDRKAS